MAHEFPPESAIWLEVNAGRRILTTCTPDDLKAQAVGFLRTEDYIHDISDIESMEIVESSAAANGGGIGARVRVQEAGVVRVGKLQRHIRENGCGLMHYAVCDRSVLCADRPLPIPPMDHFHTLLREVYAQGDAAFPDGGMHSAALCSDSDILFTMHDVGRHNTVDKAIGRAMLGGTLLPMTGLLLTSRISGAIALKAARAGVSWIASRSVPTSLAVAIADAAELPIVARAASKDAMIIGGHADA